MSIYHEASYWSYFFEDPNKLVRITIAEQDILLEHGNRLVRWSRKPSEGSPDYQLWMLVDGIRDLV